MAELGSNQYSHSGSRGMSLEDDGLWLLKCIWTPHVKKNFQGQRSYDQGTLEPPPPALEGRPVTEAEPHTVASVSQWLNVFLGALAFTKETWGASVVFRNFYLHFVPHC